MCLRFLCTAFVLLAVCWAEETPEEISSCLQHQTKKISSECPDLGDLGCKARKLACSMVAQMESDWPTQKYQSLREIVAEFWTVCNGGYLNGTDLTDHEEPEVSSAVGCPDPNLCTVDVVQYQDDHQGAKYGWKAGKASARTLIDAMKEIAKAAKFIAVAGTIGFAFVGQFLSAFFPSAGSLPVNPCTYAEEQDWGKCVWEQVKPFVQLFVGQQLDQAFEDLWTASIHGFQSRLWALNATAYHNSQHFPNGTVKSMSNQTRDAMYASLYGVHEDMTGKIKLFTTGRAINTTAGAYLSQFASLHVSVMTNLLAPVTYRTEGDRHVFQTFSACYARKTYERATEAFKARMSTIIRASDHHITQCCHPFGPPPYTCWNCPANEWYEDNWPNCDWKMGCSTCGDHRTVCGFPNYPEW